MTAKVQPKGDEAKPGLTDAEKELLNLAEAKRLYTTVPESKWTPAEKELVRPYRAELDRETQEAALLEWADDVDALVREQPEKLVGDFLADHQRWLASEDFKEVQRIRARLAAGKQAS